MFQILFLKEHLIHSNFHRIISNNPFLLRKHFSELKEREKRSEEEESTSCVQKESKTKEEDKYTIKIPLWHQNLTNQYLQKMHLSSLYWYLFHPGHCLPILQQLRNRKGVHDKESTTTFWYIWVVIIFSRVCYSLTFYLLTILVNTTHFKTINVLYFITLNSTLLH